MAKWLTKKDVRVDVSEGYFHGFLTKDAGRRDRFWLLTGRIRPEVEAVEVDGVPTGAVSVRRRFVKALTSKRTAYEAGHLLNQRLPESVWRETWPEIWLGWRNEMARHEHAREVAEDRESGVSAFARLRNAYRTPSVRACARRSI